MQPCWKPSGFSRWIAALHSIPGSIIADLVSQVRVRQKIRHHLCGTGRTDCETKSSLASLIDELTGNDYDMKGLAEFKALAEG